MNIVLWLLQALLALLYVAGGAYKVVSSEDLASAMSALPPAGWVVLGVIEVLGGVLLIVPGALKWRPSLTVTAAAVLTVETIGLAAFYAMYSLALAATNPLPWAAAMAVLVAVVAYGRRRLAARH